MHLCYLGFYRCLSKNGLLVLKGQDSEIRKIFVLYEKNHKKKGCPMNLNKDVLVRISNVNWFSNRGREVEENITFPIQYVESWEEAKESYLMPEWENITLEYQNELTSLLHRKYRSQYANWNSMAKEGRDFVERQVEPKISIFKEKYNLNQVFIDCVKWDMVNAIMESSFNIRETRVSFFIELLKVYESGNFPCGAKVKGNVTTLLVY